MHIVMQMNLNVKKNFLLGTILIFGATTLMFWSCACEPTLVDLQREVLSATTEVDSARVSSRLQKYYLALEVPPALVDTVAQAVTARLDTTKLDYETIVAGVSVAGNVYAAEHRLLSGIEKALIARAQRKDSLSDALFKDFKMKAARIDSGLKVSYWEVFTAQASRFTPEQATIWLKARRAAVLCFELHAKSKLWEDGERFGALSLQYLEHVPDERLRLDLVQRLQVILYDYRGLTDLSLLLAEQSHKRAHELGYQLRAVGILYNYADCVFQSGQNQTAFDLMQGVISATENFQHVPRIEWYKKNGYIRLAYIYWQLARYPEALHACDLAEQLTLDSSEKTNIALARGNIFLRLAKYEQAEAEYLEAKRLANKEGNCENEAAAENNLGSMFFNLKEYEKALLHYRLALGILERANSENLSRKIRLYGNMAEVYATQRNMNQSQQLLEEAQHLIAQVLQPWRKAQVFRNLGTMYFENQKYVEAASYFEQAEILCEKNNLLRLGLENKLNFAECKLRLDQLPEARVRLTQALTLAEQTNEPERVIDAYGLLARIASKQGNLAEANTISDQLIVAIESLSARFRDSDRLVLYRNKIDEFLKQAVLFEIQRSQDSLAWKKLDYEKGRSLKTTPRDYRESDTVQFVNLTEVQSKLDAKTIVLDYLMTEDSLYAFKLEAGAKPKLLRKLMKRNALQNKVEEYIEMIRNTNVVINSYQIPSIENHFKKTTALGRQLYQDLLVWDNFELPRNYECTLYIIPEAFLYEVPFATLVRDSSAETVRFVVEDAAILHVPSLSFLVSSTVTKKALTAQTAKTLVSVDPDFVNCGQLMKALQEKYANIATLETAQSLLNKDAVLTALAAKADYDILLFVGHSESNNADPDSSVIYVAIRSQASGKSDTVAITFADIKKLSQLSTQLVLLVGCETAHGKFYQGTGLVGLQYGFLSLGAKRVQASLWRIPEEEAIEQTQVLFEHWARGSVSMWTLREVQLHHIKKYGDSSRYVYPHPYLWGSYVPITTWSEN